MLIASTTGIKRDFLKFGTAAMILYTRSLLLLAIAIARTYGSIYEDVSQLPTHTFDYIIVGGMFLTLHHELKGQTHS